MRCHKHASLQARYATILGSVMFILTLVSFLYSVRWYTNIIQMNTKFEAYRAVLLAIVFVVAAIAVVCMGLALASYAARRLMMQTHGERVSRYVHRATLVKSFGWLCGYGKRDGRTGVK